jgi:hypothetical protein
VKCLYNIKATKKENPKITAGIIYPRIGCPILVDSCNIKTSILSSFPIGFQVSNMDLFGLSFSFSIVNPGTNQSGQGK